jgi:hypothetical protein
MILLKDIGDASRGFVCEEPGYELIGGDFSGFESAYLATIAGETWKRDAWEKFLRTRDPADDPYRQMGSWFGEGRAEGKVYDLAWGFGGGWRSFQSRSPDTPLTPEEIQRRCYMWRERHPAIANRRSGFWYGLHAAAVTAVHNPSAPQTYKWHRLYCRKIGELNFLFIELPSGRAIAYPGAHLVYGEHSGKPTVAVGFMDNAQGRWSPYVSPTGKPGSWHGLLTENVVQAGTRDIMAAAMLRLEAAGYEVVLTVHDEIICRVRKGEGSLEEFKHLLELQPDWAKAMGMPLGAKVWRRERWAQDVKIPVEHVPGEVVTPDMLAKPQRIKAPAHLWQPKRTGEAQLVCSHQPTAPPSTRVTMRMTEDTPPENIIFVPLKPEDPTITIPPKIEGDSFYWFDRLSGGQKDAALDHMLECIAARNGKLLDVQNDSNLILEIARSGAPHAAEISRRHMRRWSGADLRNALRRCLAQRPKSPIGPLINAAHQCGANLEPWWRPIVEAAQQEQPDAALNTSEIDKVEQCMPNAPGWTDDLPASDRCIKIGEPAFEPVNVHTEQPELHICAHCKLEPRAHSQPPFFDLVDIDDELVFAGTIIAEWEGRPRCLSAALAYASKNWRVFPAPRDTKKSFKSAEHSGGVRWGATRDPDQIRRDFTKWPDANIGIPTGADNGIFVVETDTRTGHANLKVDGRVSLQSLTDKHGPLPPTLQGMSPSGSDHFYFEWPQGLTIGNSNSKLAPGIDVLGAGGMVIAPPSVRDGMGAYRWITNIAPAKAPAWLLQLIQDGAAGDPAEREPNPDLMGPIEMIEAALAVIPNDDAPWESSEGISWNGVGMAVYAASGGSDEGEVLFDKWSQKSKAKYNADKTAEKWKDYHNSPPNRIGFGSLVYWADKADPSWRDRIAKPKPEQPPTWNPTELIISLSASDIPHRRWVYGTYLMRGEITLVVAPGGVGKTALITGMATEIAAGTELLDERIWGSSLKVLFINGEDGTAEIKRRMWAFRRAHVDRISEQTLDRLYVIGADDPRVQRLSFLRTTERNASLLDHNGFAVLESALDALRPDVLMLDPLVAFCGGGNMNDNAVMAQVMRELKRLAAEFDCAILIVHHTRKGGEQGDAETVSGAAAIVNLGRRTLMPVPMTTEEAPKLEVLPSERFRYFKLVDAKTNFTPRSADSPWYELHSVVLPNPEPPIYPHGDNVQAITRTVFPLARTASEAANDQKVRRTILDLIDRGKSIDGEWHPYSPNITGAKNMRALLDDAMVAVADATAPRQWPPDDLRAVTHAAINKMKADGWLYEKATTKGRFRNRSALYVEWQNTPWPNPASVVEGGSGVDIPKEEPTVRDEVSEDELGHDGKE